LTFFKGHFFDYKDHFCQCLMLTLMYSESKFYNLGELT
jgi:hypothetical protein